MHISLAEALEDLEGLGWVHWSIDRGVAEDYAPATRQVTWVGHKRYLYVETSSGLNMTREMEHDVFRKDIRDRLKTMEHWHYQGSGGFRTRVADTTDPQIDAWTYPLLGLL